MAGNLEAELDRIKTLGLAALRKHWTKRIGEPPPPWRSADLLRRSLAYRLQERDAGGLPPEITRRLRKIFRDMARGADLTLNGVPHIKPGTILTREWQGVLHQVRVLEDGFEHKGERFASLSEVARRITGSRWSGPLFFGLKNGNGK